MSRTLEQWEAYLANAMPRVRLLSELGLNYEDMLEIANLIKGENAKQTNIHQTTRHLIGRFPCTFVAFLAAFAAQNTEREFWDAVARLLGVTGSDLNNAKWRNHFIDILKQYKKPTFEDISFVYVANMRIHGGIPAYSLRDFFSNMLMPSIENPEYVELKGSELLDALLNRSAVQIFTDSTVRNFFEYSGEIGLEYLESCRSVAKSYNSSKQIPVLHGLPNYVVQKLTNFLEYQEDEARGLRRPRIKFDPEGYGLLLELPEEPISGADVRGNQVRWQVIQNQKPLQEQPARIVRSGRDIHSEEQKLVLGFLIEPFQVIFSLPNQDGEFVQIRVWTFELRSQDAPNLLVFRSEDGSLLRWPQALPALDLLLVYPKDISLKFEGEARLIHSTDIYAEGWQNWRAEYRSLAGGTLSLIRNGETLAIIPIQKQMELPRLVGDAFTPNLDSKLLYIGAAPTLRIPLRPGVDIGDELKRWRVEINSVWEAEPVVHQDFKLIEIEKLHFLSADESALKLDLAAVLGNEPKGTYNLRVRGPLETDIEIPFRVWTSLLIKDLPEFILPAKDQKVTLHFVLPALASLEAQAGATGINITGQHGQYAIELDESVLQLNLNLTWQLETSVIHVLFSLPVPRIKWRLVLGEDSQVQWSNRSICKSVDTFLQSNQSAALFVQMPSLKEHASQLVLRLIDPENPKKILQEFPVQASVLGSDYARFLLNATDTINSHCDVSIFEFQLLLVNKEGLYQPVSPLSLTRKVDVSNVRIEETGEGLFLLWDEPSPLRNRRVFIRSMWKVWEDAWNIKIPDDTRGKLNLPSVVKDFMPSWYEVHFYVAPSWEKDITSAPEHSTFVVKAISPDMVNAISPEDQIIWLEENFQKHPEQSFINHFECACIYVAIENASKREQEIRLCYSHLEQATPKEIFMFHEWLQKYDLNTRGAVRVKLYYPEQLKRLYAAYKSDDEFCQKYLGYVSQTYIKPESVVLLLEKEKDTFIIFHALEELVRYKDERLLEILASMLETGKLSDLDALNLLKKEGEYFLLELVAVQPSPINLRLLSGLLNDKDEWLNRLSIEKLLSTEKLFILAKADLNPHMTQKYLGVLIERGDSRGVELAMEFVQNGRLQEDEVTELLEKNPRLSMQALSVASYVHAYSVQMERLTQKAPLGTEMVSVGMFVNTPIGWAQIKSIVGKNNTRVASMQESQVLYYYVDFNLDFQYPVKAVINTEEQELSFPHTKEIYKCEHCEFLSDAKMHFHYKTVHPGVSRSVTLIPSHIKILEGLQFSMALPKKLNKGLQTTFGKVPTDPMSIITARQRAFAESKKQVLAAQKQYKKSLGKKQK